MSESDDEDMRIAIALSLGQPWPPKPDKEVIDLVSDSDEDDDDDLNAPMAFRQVSSRNNPSRKKDSVQNNSSAGSGSQEENNLTSKKTSLKSDGIAERFKAKEDGKLEKVNRVSTPSNTNSAPENAIWRGNSGTNPSTPEMGGSKKREELPTKESIASGEPVQKPSTIHGLLGLNRKEMEDARLARLQRHRQQAERLNEIPRDEVDRKRRASTSPPVPSSREGKQSKAKLSHTASVNNNTENSGEALPHRTLSHTTPINNSAKNSGEVLPQWTQQTNSKLQYPDGVVKKTWAYGFPRTGDDIKIEEVLQKADLELAVLSAFQIDHDWIQSKLDPKTKVMWVVQAKDEAAKNAIRHNADENYKFCFPSMEGQIYCMHSKLQLLSYPTHLRIVVPSANLVPYDWGETGVMENICFLIDLPRRPEGQLTDPIDYTFFEAELTYFLKAMGLKQSIIDSLRKFDFSRTAPYAFVHSIGGAHSGSDFKRTGYCGLGTAVQKLGLQTEQDLSIDAISGSIGKIDIDFMKAMYLALQGDNGLTEYECRTTLPRTRPERRKLPEDIKRLFRIYFPLKETVAKSKGGIEAGGTVCMKSHWFDGDAFPRELFRDCESRRTGLLMHSKMIFVRPYQALRDGAVAWAYVGSANFSEAAWGRLVKDQKTKKPKLNCRNWECGVIVPITANESSGNQESPASMDVFGSRVPVPMTVPGKEYEGRRPWFFNEYN
ncbi:hypothetical protein G7Y89_g9417 [Cudoniella acicularis]|uniref:PLD phosphodiesterase domain-containing protein n=1 Tax=Cudoniella acicularis TaxID=354080 RepID=A0A8H4VZN4_9HELO|nr:hypothetical protein G7Y89_g9417 [Cudoniella acicularis]